MSHCPPSGMQYGCAKIDVLVEVVVVLVTKTEVDVLVMVAGMIEIVVTCVGEGFNERMVVG